MKTFQPAIALGVILAAATVGFAAVPAAATPPAAAAAAVQATANFERDRRAILAMAGDYRVRFDMRETVPFVDGYDPLDPKTSGGHEVIRVIEDTGERISLQHMLVAEHEGETFVIKHWRQDWVFQPETVLTYAGPDEWRLTQVPQAERTGAWSQTVWQTDDSPRYGGVGRWTYENGVTEWTSGPTLRPLARRDAVRHPVYDRYIGVNRHALMPSGWVHLQDNIKLGSAEGDAGDELTAWVHEDVVNTYVHFDDYAVSAADRYWANTSDYWAAVRQAWDEAIVDGVVRVEEEAEWGSVVSQRLMGLAGDIDAGELETAAAIEQARVLIAGATRP